MCVQYSLHIFTKLKEGFSCHFKLEYRKTLNKGKAGANHKPISNCKSKVKPLTVTARKHGGCALPIACEVEPLNNYHNSFDSIYYLIVSSFTLNILLGIFITKRKIIENYSIMIMYNFSGKYQKLLLGSYEILRISSQFIEIQKFS